MSANLENSAVATVLKKGQFSFQSQRSSMAKIFKLTHNYAHLNASNVKLKILQARLQKYVNQEHPNVQAQFQRGRGTRDQIANIHWIIEKARELQKNIYFCFIDYAKAFDCVDLLDVILSRLFNFAQ